MSRKLSDNQSSLELVVHVNFEEKLENELMNNEAAPLTGLRPRHPQYISRTYYLNKRANNQYLSVADKQQRVPSVAVCLWQIHSSVCRQWVSVCCGYTAMLAVSTAPTNHRVTGAPPDPRPPDRARGRSHTTIGREGKKKIPLINKAKFARTSSSTRSSDTCRPNIMEHYKNIINS